MISNLHRLAGPVQTHYDTAAKHKELEALAERDAVVQGEGECTDKACPYCPAPKGEWS